MNIVLWVFQVALAVLYFAGGAYKVFSFDELATQLTLLSRNAWRVLGIVEVVGAILLIVPAATKRMPRLTTIAAAVLALETLFLAALYAQDSLEIAATNPLVWSLGMGLSVAFVAFGRYVLEPKA